MYDIERILNKMDDNNQNPPNPNQAVNDANMAQIRLQNDLAACDRDIETAKTIIATQEAARDLAQRRIDVSTYIMNR